MSAARIFRGLCLPVLVVLGFNLQGCGVSNARPNAEAAVVTFHQRLDAGDLDGIWNQTDEGFRKACERACFDKFIGAVHRKLGKVVTTSNTGWMVGSFNLTTRVTLTQQTEFEHGKGTEVFTFLVHDEVVKLLSYKINSMDLITL